MFSCRPVAHPPEVKAVTGMPLTCVAGAPAKTGGPDSNRIRDGYEGTVAIAPGGMDVWSCGIPEVGIADRCSHSK